MGPLPTAKLVHFKLVNYIGHADNSILENIRGLRKLDK